MTTATINGTITQATLDKIAQKVSITSRSGSGTSKSGSFNLETIHLFNNLIGDTSLVKTHHFSFGVSINPAYLSYDKKTTCYRGWTMYYFRQNKNKTWAKQWSYIRVDSTLMDMIIGAEKRIEIENTITNELIDELKSALVAIDTATK